MYMYKHTERIHVDFLKSHMHARTHTYTHTHTTLTKLCSKKLMGEVNIAHKENVHFVPVIHTQHTEPIVWLVMLTSYGGKRTMFL